MRASLRLPGSAETRCLGIGEDGSWVEAADGDGPELGSGMWALPGLVDAHAHLAADTLVMEGGRSPDILRRAYACLDNGTFLIIDKGWRDTTVIATLANRPPQEAPDLEGAGRMIATAEGYYPGFAVETDSAGLELAVAEAVAEGLGWVKLVGDWPRRGRGAVANFGHHDLVTAVDVAHRGGARVSIHTMAPEVASVAVAAGVDSIEHGLFLTGSDLESLAARGGAWVPTLLRMRAVADSLGAESSGRALIEAGIANVAELLPDAPEGVFVLAGTDLVTPSARVGQEVLALVAAGLSPRRAVDAVSTAARRYLDRPAGFELGARADAVFYPIDPIEDPAVLLRPAAVLRAGLQR